MNNIDDTLTVGQLINVLSEHDTDAPVVIGGGAGYFPVCIAVTPYVLPVIKTTYNGKEQYVIHEEGIMDEDEVPAGIFPAVVLNSEDL
ncbi:TMhelix containing protein [Vibrio phage 1.015.O._10N.222.51.E5]|nr:TMhelix containing protein [Vibrio phage 1.015.O._10N.222.51.E5]AUR83407.1 TMhelix containing protein [Vibrio phage 1.034.O._10N.261.46.B7]AUR83475.1 TMhelix containing protein [Vibrio phage 1.034.X._10N.261.46.B7]AUR90213.1 TMhelix containing protein [Vibrio phage 1.139.A._10N.261.48.C6]AUR90280.1 TMhelix containing protein [Vibrio phage 1.139.B._10N.261.48.C6]AUR95601.1 TMhelix containing protein [Vibrio phage 1.209.O._10N.222.52.B2]